MPALQVAEMGSRKKIEEKEVMNMCNECADTGYLVYDNVSNDKLYCNCSRGMEVKSINENLNIERKVINRIIDAVKRGGQENDNKSIQENI